MTSVERILVPVDLPACSQAAIDHAVMLADAFDAGIDVLHAWDPSDAYDGFDRCGPSRHNTLLKFSTTQSGQALKAVLKVLEDRGVAEVRGRLVKASPIAAILEASDSGDYDLIVMGTHGRTGLSHMLLGSVAENIVRRAGIPVATVRVPDAPKEAAPEQATTRHMAVDLTGVEVDNHGIG